jgi:hypothetical protein
VTPQIFSEFYAVVTNAARGEAAFADRGFGCDLRLAVETRLAFFMLNRASGR